MPLKKSEMLLAKTLQFSLLLPLIRFRASECGRLGPIVAQGADPADRHSGTDQH